MRARGALSPAQPPPPCRFEKLDITPKSAQKIKPVLERWMREAEERLQSGGSHALADLVGGGVGGAEPAKKRKQRTSFTPQALQVLNRFFEASTHPTGGSSFCPAPEAALSTGAPLRLQVRR